LSEEIISILKSGDQALHSAIENLVQAHGDKWLRFVQRVVQDRADAEDVLQDSVLKMLARNRYFNSLDQAKMYFGRVISNTAIEAYHRRRRRRSRSLPLNDQLACVPLSSPQPWDIEEPKRSLILKILKQGLSRLPPKQYQALRLTLLNSAISSMRDIGAQVGIPYSTLRDRRQQGLCKLRKLLSKSMKKWTLADSVRRTKEDIYS
jgi:RNA polymerase sigma-70 factor, ECF subfamily